MMLPYNVLRLVVTTLTGVKADRKADGILRQCPSCKGHKVSIKFFNNLNLTLGNIFWLMYLWLHHIPVYTAESMLQIGDDTIWQWYQCC